MEALHVDKPDLAERIEGRARAWIEQYGANFPGDLLSGVLGKSDEELERFEEFANDAPCPALDPATGLCDVYPWRPMTCRVFGPPVRMGDGDALGHCELCFKGATDAEVAACEMTVPHDLEESLVEALEDRSDTLVAFALLRAAIREKSLIPPR